MKAVFVAEWIGACPAGTMRPSDITPIPRHPKPWLAEIVGPDARYTWQRRFLPGKVDYTDSNKRGSRGIRVWWTLEGGKVYQAHYRTTWSTSGIHLQFLTVTGGEVVTIGEQQVKDRFAAHGAIL